MSWGKQVAQNAPSVKRPITGICQYLPIFTDICTYLPPIVTADHGEDPVAFIISQNIHRRNLTQDQRDLAIGRLYEAQKKDEGAQKGNQNRSIQPDQIEPVETKSTAEKIAKDVGVSPASFKRNAALAREVEQGKAATYDGR